MFDPDHVDVEVPELATLGLDPLVDTVDPVVLRAALAGRRTRLKPLLLDQHVLAGIGNIYADEILHAARLHPERQAGSLRPAEVRRLHDAMHAILAAAVGAGGSTLPDARYVDLMGGRRLLPGRSPRVRAGGGALHDMRQGHHPADRLGWPFDALLPRSRASRPPLAILAAFARRST